MITGDDTNLKGFKITCLKVPILWPHKQQYTSVVEKMESNIYLVVDDTRECAFICSTCKLVDFFMLCVRACLNPSLSLLSLHADTHTHTHTHIYIYIYIYMGGGGEFLNLLNLIDIYITMDVGHTLDLLKNVASLTHFHWMTCKCQVSSEYCRQLYLWSFLKPTFTKSLSRSFIHLVV